MMAGFEKVIFIIKRENEQDFRDLIDGRAGKHMEVEYAFQELTDIPEGFDIPEGRVKPWGTGHAVLAARKLIDGPFAVINADDYYGADAFHKIYDHLEKAKDGAKYDFSMVAYQLSKTVTENGSVSRGICSVTPDGLLADVTERTNIVQREDGIAYSEDDGASWTDVSGDTMIEIVFVDREKVQIQVNAAFCYREIRRCICNVEYVKIVVFLFNEFLVHSEGFGIFVHNYVAAGFAKILLMIVEKEPGVDIGFHYHLIF
jgi:dTDP-glucose pyrophosphorylase